jgi:hypothetical protein
LFSYHKCPIKSTRGLYSRGLPTRGKRRDPCGDWSFQTKPKCSWDYDPKETGN